MKLLVFLFLMFSGAALMFSGAASAEVIPGFGGTKNQPIKITSEELAIDQLAKEALFSGKVKASQADISITALRMSIIYKKGDDGLAPKFLYASGNVVLTGAARKGKSPPVARGDLAEYNIETKKLILTGKVRLTQEGQVINGQSLSVDIVSGFSQLDSTKDGQAGRIKGTFKR